MAFLGKAPELLDVDADREEVLRVLRDYLETPSIRDKDGKIGDVRKALDEGGDMTPSLALLHAMRDGAARIALRTTEASGLYGPTSTAGFTREEAEDEQRTWEETVWRPLHVLVEALEGNF